MPEPTQPDTRAAAVLVMEAIHAQGGNPRWPHGGNALLDALWHLCRAIAEERSAQTHGGDSHHDGQEAG
jgi:hypothetical protein